MIGRARKYILKLKMTMGHNHDYALKLLQCVPPLKAVGKWHIDGYSQLKP